MKNRLLSMLLLVAMVATALPLGVFSLVSFAAEEKEMTEAEYNGLYVTDGLAFSLDFFKLNEYWSPDGHTYEIPKGPSDNAAYYDATTGKTFDFTKSGNRFVYAVNKTAADGAVTKVGDYLGEAEANAAIAELTAADTEGATYSATATETLHAAWKRAAEAWLSADRAFFDLFTNYAAIVDGKRIDFYSSNSDFPGTSTSNRHSYARSAVASLGNGSATLLPSGKSFVSGGGLQLLNAPAGLDTFEMVSVLGGDLSAAGGYMLFNNAGLVPTKNATDGTYLITAAMTDRSVKFGTFTKSAAFPYNKITSLTYTMADGIFSMYNGAETVLEAPYTGTESATYYMGWAGRSYSTELYAIRYYLDVLTAEERAQNHFADLAKFFRLDVADFVANRYLFRAADVEKFYEAFAGLDFASERDEVQAAADAAYAVLLTSLNYPDISEDEYDSLYVGEDLLLSLDFFPLNGYWNKAADYGTPEVGSTRDNTQLNVRNWVRQFMTFGGNEPSFVIYSGSDRLDAEGTHSPHIPFLIKDGYVQFKEKEASVNNDPPYVQFYFSKSYTVDADGFTMESLLSYDAVTPGVQSKVWLPWAFSFNPALTLNSKDSFTVKGSGIWSDNYTLASTPTFTHNGKPFTMTYTLEADGTSTSANLIANGTSLTTGTYGKVDGGTTCCIGYYYGSYGMKLYATRLYDRTLSAEEMAQNHFADMAKWFRLDVKELIEWLPLFEEEDLNAYYAAFSSLSFASTREEAEAVANAAFAILKETVELGTTDAAFYNSLYVKRDLLFQMDFFALNGIWGEAEKYGTITATDSSSGTKSAVVKWLNQFVIADLGTFDLAIQGNTGDSGATNFNHQIPFFIKNGYIQYKSFADGYTVNNNNPYIQFLPANTSYYNNGGFTWEMQISLDEFTKTGSFALPALSDLRPNASMSSPTKDFTVTSATGFTASELATLQHNGRAFDLTYRLEATEGNYETLLSAGSATLGKFTKTTAFGGRVCDFGWNFNESGAKIYAVRIYDRCLSNEELLQNHFADLAKFFRLTLDGFVGLSAANKQRVYETFAGYDLETSTFPELQKAYNDLVTAMVVEEYEAHYREGDDFAAHNAFVDACIARFLSDRVRLSLDAIYTLPLSERAAIYALEGEALTQKAVDDAIAAYWSFDREKYDSYNSLYYDAGNLIVAYDFFSLNAYWNADRVAGYLPTSTLVSSWESRTGDGGRYLDRFAVKGQLDLIAETVEIPFVIPSAAERGFGGFVLLGEESRAGDGFSVSGLGSTTALEAVLRPDGAGETLFSVSGLSFGIEDGLFTAPSGIHALTSDRGIGSALTLGGVATYDLTASNAGLGKTASLSLLVDGAEVYSVAGTAMADPTERAYFGTDASFAGAVYAIRYYRTALTEGQRAQNHFADIAKFFRLDLADVDLILAAPAAAAELYAAYAAVGFDADRAEAQKIYDDFRAAFLAEHTGLADLRTEASAAVTLEGYQVRIAGTDGPAPNAYAGMRAIFTVDASLLASLEAAGYQVRLEVLARNAERDNSFCGRIVPVLLYDGERYVAKSQEIDGLGDCYVVTVLYASGEEGNKLPLPDERIRELMSLDVAYDYAVILEKDGVSYSFTYRTPTDRFGEAVNAKELYCYFGIDGDDELQGSEKNDTLVKKMVSLAPAEKSAVAAPLVGRLPLATDGTAHYSVVLPEGASEGETAAVSAFLAGLTALTGAEFPLSSEAALRLDREILIARGSSREDAIEFAAASAAEGLAYAIGVSGERILVYAEDDAALSDALSVLLASVTDNRVGDALGENAAVFYLPAVLSIKESGDATASLADFTLVLPVNMDSDRRAIVDAYLAALAERTGITLTAVTDGATVSGRRILLNTANGSTGVAKLLSAASYTGYTITASADDLVVSSYTDIALRAALSTLFAAVSDGGSLPADLAVSCDFGAGAGVPHFVTAGRLDGGQLYEAGNDSYTVSHTLVTEAEYLAYPALLEAAGFVKVGENERNGCLFATYAGDGCDVIVAYYPMLGQVKITIQPKGYLLPTGEAEAYVKDPDVTPSVTLMDHELASYVMQLEDGSFLIVDGGDLNRAGAMEKMWAHLTSLTPEGEKPRIALWMLTHGHSDHVILATHFLEKYRNDLVLDAVAFNFPNYEVVDMPSEYAAYSDAISKDAAALVAVIDRYYPDVEKWIPRTGQVHSLAGAEIEILMSHEDHYPSKFHWGNDTSSAWRITLGGTSTVYLGDCTDVLCRRIATTFGETLESDILQVAHHGVGGGDLGLYQLIDPKICLFGTSVGEFTGDRCNGTGSYTSYNYNTWVRTTDWTRTVNGVEVTGERTHYHGSVRTTILLPIDE